MGKLDSLTPQETLNCFGGSWHIWLAVPKMHIATKLETNELNVKGSYEILWHCN